MLIANTICSNVYYELFLGPDKKLCTAWIALTDSNITNGCVRFIR